MHPELAPVAFLTAASVLLVLPWHWRAGNVATISLAAWLFTVNIIYGVGAVVWGDNVKIVIPVWCDITTKLIIGSQFALPAACLCIAIHLERVASVRAARITSQDKRRRQLFEAGMCIGLPVLFMALHYIVQGHRFDIIEGYGCRPTTYISYVGIALMYIPPLLMAFVAFVYSAFALRHFLKRRVTFALHLQASNSALTTSRYFRLMSMALAQMITSIAITSYTLWFTLMAVPIRPYTSWADVHSDWLRIDQFFSMFMPPLILRSYYALWWVVPFSTLLFVAFFAFGQEAVDEYKKCFAWIRIKVFRQKPTSSEKILPTSSVLNKMAIKVSLPSFLGGSKNDSSTSMTTSTTTTTTTKSSPDYKYPRPPPPKYLSDFSSSSESGSSQFTPIASPTSFVDLEANPLPPTPSSYASTASTSTVKRYFVADDIIDAPHSPSTSITPSQSHIGHQEEGLEDDDQSVRPLPSQLPPPPPSRPRVRPPPPSFSEPGSPRPLTYPSADAWHRSITQTFPSS